MVLKADKHERTFNALSIIINDADFNGISDVDIRHAYEQLKAVQELRLHTNIIKETLKEVIKETQRRADGHSKGSGEQASLNSLVRYLQDEMNKEI